ncbi:CDP-6-deoxy-delta-3,4-glucoseen reductase [soil metagenome]
MEFTVTLRPTGHQFKCNAETPILRSGLAAGMFLAYSCRSGVCQTCRGRVVDGDVDFGQVHPAYLTEQDKAEGYALLCQAMPKSDVTIEVHELAANEATRSRNLPVRVLRTERLAPDVMMVELGTPANEPVQFLAGQYLDIDSGNGEKRSYSIANISNAEGVRQLELHIRHMPGGLFTERVFNKLKAREMLKIEVPLGTFYLREDSDKPMIMIASGTGFAPIKAIIEHGLRMGHKRPITLYWGGRRRNDIYMAKLAEQWAQEHHHITFVPVLSDATAECYWTGRTGFVHHAAMHDFPDMSGHQVYACGAPVVVEGARRDFVADCALPPDEFYADSFITAADRAPMPSNADASTSTSTATSTATGAAATATESAPTA